MQFKLRSIGYSSSKPKMMEYKDLLKSAGISVVNFVFPDDKDYSTYSHIIIDINSAEDFVKVTAAVGEVIYSGSTMLIYDDYYE